MDNIGGRPTISDIALAAGVSKTTVSRYINGREDLMSEKTRERIKAVIEVSNYKPSDVARSLKMKRTNLIGVVVSDMSSPFSSALVIGIGEYLTERGYTPLFVHCDDSIEREVELINMLLAKGVAGLLVNTTSRENNNLIRIACQGIPVVLCDRYIDDYRFNIVTVEHDSAIFELVSHLKNQGYTRPVLFTQQWDKNSSRLRRKNAFVSAVKKLYDYDPQDDIYVISRKRGITATMQLEILLGRLKEGDIPAVIGTNSVTTVRTYKAIKSRELKIPEEIGICGPEDWNWQSEMNWPMIVDPTITTLFVPTGDLGMRSAKLLVDVIEKRVTKPEEIMLPCELKIRKSTSRKP